MVTHAQTVYFGYDASGNRTSRTISLLKSTRENKDEHHEFKDKLGDQDVLIYPNPVESELTIEIPTLEDEEFASISLYDQEGRLIYSNDQATASSTLNIADQFPGIYFLTISIGENITQWKIIKE